MFRALVSERITLYLKTEENQDEVRSMLEKTGDAYTLGEFEKSYLPDFENGRQTKFGFYSTLDGTLAGLSLLGVSNFKHKRGYSAGNERQRRRAGKQAASFLFRL